MDIKGHNESDKLNFQGISEMSLKDEYQILFATRLISPFKKIVVKAMLKSN